MRPTSRTTRNEELHPVGARDPAVAPDEGGEDLPAQVHGLEGEDAAEGRRALDLGLGAGQGVDGVAVHVVGAGVAREALDAQDVLDAGVQGGDGEAALDLDSGVDALGGEDAGGRGREDHGCVERVVDHDVHLLADVAEGGDHLAAADAVLGAEALIAAVSADEARGLVAGAHLAAGGAEAACEVEARALRHGVLPR